jgi:MFS family permease
LIYGMTNGLLWTLGGLGMLGFFFLSESRAAHPLLPLNVFKNRMFSLINLMTFFQYAAFSMVFFYLPTQLIRVDNYSPAQAGLALAPAGLLIAALSRPVGAWMVSRGSRLFLVAGSTLVALGCGVVSLAPVAGNYLASYLPGLVLIGIGFGLLVTPLTSTAMTSLSDEESGLASGINNAVARVGGVVGVALAAGLLTWSFRGIMGQDWKKDPLMEISVSAPAEFKKSVDAARRSSYRELLWASAAMSALAGLTAAKLRKRSEASRDMHPEVSGYCFRDGSGHHRQLRRTLPTAFLDSKKA